MKKLFTALLLSAATLPVFSQQKGNFEFGLNAGLNLSTVTSGSETNKDYRTGLLAGVYGDYFFSEEWSIKAKVSYDQKGWNNGYLEFEDYSIQTNYQLDYLTVPVMANWHFGHTKNWYINLGPYAGFLLSAKESTMGLDLKPIARTVDIGLALGIGVKIPLSSKVKFLVELDGQSGFTDAFAENEGNTIRNSRSSIVAGLAFSL